MSSSIQTFEFERFLQNPINQQISYLKNHPSEQNQIIECAKAYLQKSSTQLIPNNLKLKAWLLLPKKMTKDYKWDKTAFDSNFEQDLIKSVIETKEYWRFKQLKKCGIDINLSQIEQNTNIMLSDENQKTPLHYLCEIGHEELALQLFKKFCKKNHITILKSIMIASSLGLTKIAKQLIDELNDVNRKAIEEKDNLINGDSLIHAMVHLNQFNKGILDHLVKKGANLEQLDAINQTPLASALFPYSEANDKIIQYLLDAGAKVNASLLQQAITKEIPEKITKLLISRCQELNQKDAKGYTPFEQAILSPHPSVDLIRHFLEIGMKVDQKNEAGNTPLHLAVMSKYPDEKVIKFLITQGANINAVNKNGESPAFWIQIKKLDVEIPSKNIEWEEEFELRKLLANSWSIDKETEMDGLLFPLSGAHQDLGQKKAIELLKSLKDFSAKSVSSEDARSTYVSLEDACKTIEKALKRAQKDPHKIAEDFKKGKALIFDTGWEGHAIQVSFVGDYMLVANRGAGRQKASIVPYKIDRNSQQIEYHIQHLQVLAKFFNEEDGQNYFYGELPKALGFSEDKQDLIYKVIQKKCQQSSQKMGNCWYKSPTCGVLGILSIQRLLKETSVAYKSENEREKAYEHILDATQAVYKYYSEFNRFKILKEYMERPPDQVGRDHELVKFVYHKLITKEWKYILKQEDLMSQIFVSLVKLLRKSHQSIPPLYTKDEIDQWFLEYKEKFKLGDDFPIETLMFIGR